MTGAIDVSELVRRLVSGGSDKHLVVADMIGCHEILHRCHDRFNQLGLVGVGGDLLCLPAFQCLLQGRVLKSEDRVLVHACRLLHSFCGEGSIYHTIAHDR